MKTHLFNALLLIVFIAGLQSCSTAVKTPEPEVALSEEAMIEKGRYLATIGACHDCHSPKVMTAQGPEPDPTRLLSGHPNQENVPPVVKTNDWILFNMGLTAFVGPWGMSFAANLTPDDTGIGNWSYKQFETVLRKGKYKGLENGRDLLPPMPWQMYQHLTDQDMRSLFAYLKSLPPVNNLVPAPVPPQDVVALK
jgi:cytochrome c553